MILQNKALKVEINSFLCPFYLERNFSSVDGAWVLKMEVVGKPGWKPKNKEKERGFKKMKKSQPNYP
jgi:hypothetical protein